ncbi:MAG: DNA polymerase I [Bacteroidales bacterium]|nr:DNA polymerase I [Bacteroidales bacterium]MBQ6101281.1 DNA polymerase I [Bacteroidales bacterium]
MDQPTKKLFLLDAYALIYRAFFAMSKRPAMNSKGLNTSAVMGFLNTLYDVLRNEKPTHIGVAFDLHAPTVRVQEFSEYKANRESMPDDLRASIPYIIRLIEGFNIPVYAAEGYEADDVIGTLSHKAEKEGFVTYMMTPDKDFGQLVTDKVLIYKPAKFGAPAQVLGPKDICEKYGIDHPSQVIDILGLWGDASDNIPGIPGIGEKNASLLISKYGSVEGVIAHADELKGKQQENVRNFAEQGLMSKHLATIMLDAPVEFNAEELELNDPDVPALLELFDELEFRTFKQRFIRDYGVVEADLKQPSNANVPTPTISAPNISIVVLNQSEDQWESHRAEIENPKITKVGYNLKPILTGLRRKGITPQGRLFDVMIAHYLIEPEQRHTLEYLSDIYLHRSYSPQGNLWAPDEGDDIVKDLFKVFLPMLKENGLEKLFYEIEMPLVTVLSVMEENGVKIDSQNLRNISEEFGKHIHELEESIYAMAGVRFNIASPRQLGEVLFDKLQLDAKAKKTKTGQYATGEEVLQKLAGKHPIINAILEYRSYTKLKSTYLDALPALINPKDGLIHTSYNQAVTATGRLSSNNPNLQNIPVRTANGREIRRAFVPRSPEYTLLAADYSQIELRIIAHLSQDPAMIADFNLGHDIHAATAAKVFHVPIDQVTKEQRSRAKAVNFGIIYGMSAFGLAERMEISRSEAADIIKKYFEEYAGIKEYMNRSIALAKERGYAETILGRRRYLRDINAANGTVRNFAERNAINAPIQGSSADMIKIAMIGIHQELQKLKMQSKMILQVHDELVFDAHLDELSELKALVSEKMVNAMPLSVPVIVEINTGNNWLEAH